MEPPQPGSGVQHLIAAEYFKQPVTREQIVWSFAGVRPLYDDGDSDPSAITRDYVLDLDGKSGEAPLLSVYGGKLTTSRRLAEHALQKLTGFYPKMGKPWSGTKPLPGGDLGMAFDVFVADLRHKYPGLDPAWLVNGYGPTEAVVTPLLWRAAANATFTSTVALARSTLGVISATLPR